MAATELSNSPQKEDIPSYCQVLRFKDSNGQVKEMIFPKALDLDRPKRPRTTFSESQLSTLEREFQKCQYLIGRDRTRLAESLGLSETQIKVWFQNRRTKSKRDKPGDHLDDVSSQSSGEPTDPECRPPDLAIKNHGSHHLPSDPTPAVKEMEGSKEASEEDYEDADEERRPRKMAKQSPKSKELPYPDLGSNMSAGKPEYQSELQPFLHPGFMNPPSSTNLLAALSQQAGNLVGTSNEIGLLQPKMDPATFGFLTPSGAFKPVICPSSSLSFQSSTQTSSPASLLSHAAQPALGQLPYSGFHPTLFSTSWMFK